ncbi:short chain dehydrogenase domain-containing protein [Trichoderma breve]|uniref:Short chain dehydrogenase domain-containing protein n=1 Tax=Trichoderma breve TaxID=2034170 RepID=A0A9W9JSM4_9HYPO|nr:short chain dehydrogenase domain-containing protein [Trichoderma breve]KAJ4865426.1 short chain dehydrogenase domain-containing protein [Trichoderma breve]
MGGIITQMWPPKPAFTEQNLGDLSAQVYIVTGSNTGVGKELAQILYSKKATVYVAARSEAKATEAIEDIRGAFPTSTGRLEFLALDLSDLSAVARSAKEFITRESKLDVLFNNAGVMHPPQGSKTKQGYELQLGVNNLGHLLFTELLTPLLATTAASYAASSPNSGGFDPENMGFTKKEQSTYYKYSVSKAGVYYQAAEYAKRYKDKGIISLAVNPGNLRSDLQRYGGQGFLHKINQKVILFPAINGAYSELFCGLSPDVTAEKSGSYAIPWGRLAKIREDIEKGSKSTKEGGTGMGKVWYDWCLEQVEPFMH